MKKRTKKIVALSMAAIIAASSPAYAGLEQVMEGAFNAEINVTKPDAYMGARRGSVSFGKVRIANKISSAQLVTFSPPGFKAGCGGIDAWGGSFSFISGKQLEALAKNIASNAAGYAFELALSKFPDGNAAIKTIRALVKAANDTTINSCQAAKKLVNAVVGAVDNTNAVASTTAANKGTVIDAFTGFFGGSALSKVDYNDLIGTEAFRANPVWSALDEAGVGDWFDGGDEHFQEAMMSFVGAVVLKKDGSVDKDGNEQIKPTSYPPILKVADLVQGGQVKIYHCNDDAICDELTTGPETITGLNDRVYTALVGTSSTTGIIDKFYDGTEAFTPEEKQLIGSLAPNVGGIIRDLSRDPGTAKQFAKDASAVIAFNTACDMATEIINNLRDAVSAKPWAATPAVIEKIDYARGLQLKECESARQGASDMASMLQIHQQLTAFVKKGL